MNATEASRSGTTTQVLPPPPAPVILSLHMRTPQPEVNATTQAVAQPSFEASASAPAAHSRPLNIHKAKVINYMKAILSFRKIQRCFDLERTKWQDLLSQGIFKWADDFNDFVLQIFLPSRRADEEFLDEALNGLEARINRLFNVILRDPYEAPKIVDNPLIEGEHCIWGEVLLNKCKAFAPISPYTEKPFDAKPHLLARAILKWGMVFFPAHFSGPNAKVDTAPLDMATFIKITKNAEVIVLGHKAKLELDKTERTKQEKETFAREIHQSNFQMLLQRSIQAVNEDRAANDARCQRLNQTIVQLTQFFETAIAGLNNELANRQADNDDILARLVRLEVYAAGLESRNRALMAEVGMLRQSVAYAQQRMNDGGGGGNCIVM